MVLVNPHMPGKLPDSCVHFGLQRLERVRTHDSHSSGSKINRILPKKQVHQNPGSFVFVLKDKPEGKGFLLAENA